MLLSSQGSHREQNTPNSNVLFIPPQLVKWSNSELLKVFNLMYKDREESSPDFCCQQDMGDLMDPSFLGPVYVLSSEASSAQATLP